jgi:uncharacterized membrane protein
MVKGLLMLFGGVFFFVEGTPVVGAIFFGLSVAAFYFMIRRYRDAKP